MSSDTAQPPAYSDDKPPEYDVVVANDLQRQSDRQSRNGSSLQQLGYQRQPPRPSGVYYCANEFRHQNPIVLQPFGNEGLSRQSVIVLSAGGNVARVSPTTLYQQVEVEPSYSRQILLACFVFWFCNPPFGLMAFILAVAAENSRVVNVQKGRRLARISMSVSVAGFIITILVACVIVGLTLSRSRWCRGGFSINGMCYSSRRDVESCRVHCCSPREVYYKGFCYTMN